MKRIISIFLIIFLVIGQTGFTLATHYCGGYAVKTAVLVGNNLPDCGKAMMSSCEMEMPSDDGPLVKSEPCCANHFTTVEANNELLTGIIDNEISFTFGSPVLADSYIPVTDQEDYLPLASGNSPPIAVQDLQALFQSYLI